MTAPPLDRPEPTLFGWSWSVPGHCGLAASRAEALACMAAARSGRALPSDERTAA